MGTIAFILMCAGTPTSAAGGDVMVFLVRRTSWLTAPWTRTTSRLAPTVPWAALVVRALGPSDTSDSGSDLTGEPDSELDSDTDAEGTGESDVPLRQPRVERRDWSRTSG